MNRSATEKRLNLWWVWNYRQEETRLDKLSQQGLQFERPRPFYAVFLRDHSTRYVYRLDYQPRLKRQEDLRHYLDLYQDAGWEYKGCLKGWRYFRRTWSSDERPSLYTDQTSLKQLYRRIQHLLGAVFGIEMALFALDLMIGARRAFSLKLPLLGIWGALFLFLAYGYLKIRGKVRQMDQI